MASFTLYDTNLEWRNSSENTTESTENVCSSVRYCDQSIFLVSSYTSSAVVALKWRIGLSILMAVCSWKLARYMSSLLPLNDTIRLPICTSLAPSSVSSFAKTGSRPMNVLAINSNSCSICCLVWILAGEPVASVRVGGGQKPCRRSAVIYRWYGSSPV